MTQVVARVYMSHNMPIDNAKAVCEREFCYQVMKILMDGGDLRAFGPIERTIIHPFTSEPNVRPDDRFYEMRCDYSRVQTVESYRLRDSLHAYLDVWTFGERLKFLFTNKLPIPKTARII